MSNITARHCEKSVTKQSKYYDAKCAGLYVSVSPRGVATFNWKYFDPAQGKQRTVALGIYSKSVPDVPDFGPDEARAKVCAMRYRLGQGEDIANTSRVAKVAGKTVNDLIAGYIEDIKTPEKKGDGEMRPRVESWRGIEAYLNRLIAPRLGTMAAVDVTCDDIAVLQSDILKGKLGKASTANARHMRSVGSSLFKWACEAGRRYVKASPFVNLPKLPKETQRERHLLPDEIRKLWWGLDHPDVPCSRSIALAIKFELATMLRTREFLTATPDEITGLGTAEAQITVPLKRVKKRRQIVQPLSDLAQEIIKEALADNDQPFIFSGRFKAVPLNRMALGLAVRENLLDFLKMERFTPHDLRRTAATMAGELEYSDEIIGKCLDHAKESDKVTLGYNQSKRLKQKREVLDAVAARIREIIGEPPAASLRRAA
jgi:integrase